MQAARLGHDDRDIARLEDVIGTGCELDEDVTLSPWRDFILWRMKPAIEEENQTDHAGMIVDRNGELTVDAKKRDPVMPIL